MNKVMLLIIISCSCLSLYGQTGKKYVRQGNKQYENKKYVDAEISYRKALEKNNKLSAASYNLGNALYRQEKFDEASKFYNKALEDGMNKKDMAKVYHNMGNSLLQQQKYQESIDAYKKALRINPTDLETKYNLALAQKYLKNPPKQKQNNQQNQNNRRKIQAADGPDSAADGI